MISIYNAAGLKGLQPQNSQSLAPTNQALALGRRGVRVMRTPSESVCSFGKGGRIEKEETARPLYLALAVDKERNGNGD